VPEEEEEGIAELLLLLLPPARMRSSLIFIAFCTLPISFNANRLETYTLNASDEWKSLREGSQPPSFSQESTIVRALTLRSSSEVMEEDDGESVWRRESVRGRLCGWERPVEARVRREDFAEEGSAGREDVGFDVD
jgi:hypothetical protein